jgi:diketogulonate reductase-like aldo/keto reductase
VSSYQITSYRGGEKRTFDDPTIQDIAPQHGKWAAHVMLQSHVQQARSAIPKSTKPPRITEHFDIFNFELSDEQMTAIDALDTGVRGGPDSDGDHARDLPQGDSRGVRRVMA